MRWHVLKHCSIVVVIVGWVSCVGSHSLGGGVVDVSRRFPSTVDVELGYLR